MPDVEYNIVAIRRLLLEAFTARDLYRFCQDSPSFRPVTQQFGPGVGLQDMVDVVIDYSRTRLLWDELLAEVESFNPRQYQRHASWLYAARERTYEPLSSPLPDALSEPGPLPPRSLLPYPRDPEFADRTGPLKKLAQALLGSPLRSPTLIWGVGGVGKTRLAVEFAYRYGRYFRGVYWLNGANPLETEIVACGRAMELASWPREPSRQADRTLKAWQERGPWLVIVDGLDDVAVAQNWLPRLAGPSIRLLATSRRGDWPASLGLNLIELEAFTESGSRAFLRGFLPADRASDEDLDRLANALGHLPLALELAGGYLARHPELAVGDYLTSLTQETGQNLMAQFAVMWGQVTSETARSVMRVAAWCAPNQPIPPALLHKAAGVGAQQGNKAVELLVGLGLLAVPKDALGPVIHPLVAEYVRSLPAGPHTDEAAQALQALAGALVELGHQALDTARPAEFEPLRPHVEAVAAWAEEAALETAGRLWSSLGLNRRMVADYGEARAAFERALRIDRKVLGEKDSRVAGDVNNLGAVLRDMGDLAGARAAFEQALVISRATRAAARDGSPEWAAALRGEETDLGNLGATTAALGDAQQAIGYYEQALAIARQIGDRVLEENHLGNLGATYAASGKARRALDYYEQAVAIATEIGDQPGEGSYLSSMGSVLYDLDDLAEAQSAFERALAIHEKLYNPAHPAVVRDRDNLAMARYDLEGLVAACLDGSCALFAGSGLSERAGLPGWDAFVEGLRAWAVEQGHIDEGQGASLRRSIEAGDSSLAADAIAVSLQRRNRQSELNAYLGQIFGDPDRQPTEIHRTLAAIRFGAALTPNHDRLLEQAFEPAPQVYTPTDADSLLGALVKPDFYLLKLRGTLDRPETVILAPTQYQDALASNRSLGQFMSSLFVSRTIFFLGTSLDEILAYCGGIKFAEAARQHYAVVPVLGSAWEAKVEQLRQRYNIQVLPYRSGDVARELTVAQALARRVAARAGARAPAEGPRKRSGLKTVRLENIGPFQELNLDLDAHCTVLLGDNGVGKTTILKAIAVAICGEDARSYAERLIRIGTASERCRITLETTDGARYVTELRRTATEAEVISVPQRPLEIEGWLAIGFPPLRGLAWQRSPGPQTESVKQGLSAGDLLPLMAGGLDPRINDLKQWLVNLDYRISRGQDKNSRRLFDDFATTVGHLAVGMKLENIQVDPKTYQVTVETDGVRVPIELLSQGTQSLMGWVAVLVERMHELYDQADRPRDEPALVLIDEIDAHMHPRWQQTIVPGLIELFPQVQFVATTHSPLVVAEAQKDQVWVLAKDESGQVVARRPREAPQGMGAAGLLTSDLFNLPTQLDRTTQDKLDRQRQLAAQDPSRLTADEREELQRLDGELAELGLTYQFRDRLYSQFLEAWAKETRKRQKASGPPLSEEEQEFQEALTRKIVAGLKSTTEA